VSSKMMMPRSEVKLSKMEGHDHSLCRKHGKWGRGRKISFGTTLNLRQVARAKVVRAAAKSETQGKVKCRQWDWPSASSRWQMRTHIIRRRYAFGRLCTPVMAFSVTCYLGITRCGNFL
jgi:hypothetical protein